MSTVALAWAILWRFVVLFLVLILATSLLAPAGMVEFMLFATIAAICAVGLVSLQRRSRRL